MALFGSKNLPVLPFFASCLDARLLGEPDCEAAEEPARSTTLVYRDELSKPKRKTGRHKIAPDAEKGGFSRDPVDGEKRVLMRVKVKMTKEQAARLLSKCGEGGVLEFRDVARELVQIPATRVSVVSGKEAEDGAVRELKSIPEEDEARA